jgi:two-component system, NarL family, sensor kinase
LSHRKNNSKVRSHSRSARQNPAVGSGESFGKEAQEILQAIRRGRIDGLVMEGPGGEKIVMLQGTDQPYRVLVESINDGAATLDAAGTIRYANKRFAEILNKPLKKLLGATLESNLPVWQRAKFRDLFDQASRRSAGLELTLDATEGRPRLVRFTLKPLKNTPIHKMCIVATELTELVEANEALKSNEESLRQLSARLLQIQDEERRHIARDLHDVTGQKLAFQCMALSGVLSRNSTNLDANAQQALTESLALNKEVSSEIRTLSYLLHPPLLDELGLSSAARWYAAGFTKRTGIPIDVQIATGLKRLSPDAEVAIFRVLQESLTNVHRHSNTTKARLSIQTTDDEIKVEIEDFGQGFQAVKSKSTVQTAGRLGVGIQGMRERIRQIGGQLEIIAKPNRGTLVSATIPFSSSHLSASAHAGSARSPSTSFVHTEEVAESRNT